MSVIQNPILSGFNPDPSIIRVGEDYYIATSTFEWFPGVQIHHSKDLVHWTLVAHPLNRKSQLDMRGNPDSCGVWAPCLSYHAGLFYLVYSNVRSFDGVWKDTPNYLVTSTDILGDWSEPIFLSSSGFDGSLFHDDNGQKWYTSMICDHRGGKLFGGIFVQEYDPKEQQLVGPVQHIFEGSSLGITEAPHLYKRYGYYYLITAEGGTEYGHAVSLARSRQIEGPYTLHPHNPIITSRNDKTAPLQKCGHADLVATSNDEWYAVFLVGRPLSMHGRCTLGRETAIEQLEWRADDWLYRKEEGTTPRLQVPAPQGISFSEIPASTTGRIAFEEGKLNIHFQSLRVPIDESWLSLTDRPGYLRLYGRESLSSCHHQSLIARRVQGFDITVSSCLAFQPVSFQQMAGMVAYYNTGHWIYLHLMGVGKDEPPVLQIIACDNFEMEEMLDTPLALPSHKAIYLRISFNKAALQCFYSFNEEEWEPIGPVLDGSILSDDHVTEGGTRYRPAFTGAFIGLCCQDLTGQKITADFKWYEYLDHN